MNYAYICVPVAPVRKTAGHKAEITNQLFFADVVKITGQHPDAWSRVESTYDGYTGWVKNNQLQLLDVLPEITKSTSICKSLLTRVVFNKQTMHVPMGTTLHDVKNGVGRFGKLKLKLNVEDWGVYHQQKASEKQLKKIALQWLNAPYLWGGKTILGVDCSGFAQTVCKLMGIELPRDAWQQAGVGELIPSLSEARPGHLAFFSEMDDEKKPEPAALPGKSSNKKIITHVGILLSGTKIIHASGRVKIDAIDKKGIINGDTGQYSHRLKIIRQVW